VTPELAAAAARRRGHLRAANALLCRIISAATFISAGGEADVGDVELETNLLSHLAQRGAQRGRSLLRGRDDHHERDIVADRDDLRGGDVRPALRDAARERGDKADAVGTKRSEDHVRVAGIEVRLRRERFLEPLHLREHDALLVRKDAEADGGGCTSDDCGANIPGLDRGEDCGANERARRVQRERGGL
jgi:hypothetical protein